MGGYWNGRFEKEGRIWGNAPSITAGLAEEAFRRSGVKSVLVPGAGYGRNADFFAKKGYAVSGIEISEEALKLAGGTAVKYYHGSVFDMPFSPEKYDAIYCFNVLHLFLREERRLFVGKCHDALRDGGMAFFVVFSEQERQFGRGKQVEENTFESKPGRPVHFFTEEDLLHSMEGFAVLETGLTEDPEDHGEEGPHLHAARYVSARKLTG